MEYANAEMQILVRARNLDHIAMLRIMDANVLIRLIHVPTRKHVIKEEFANVVTSTRVLEK